MQLWPDDSKYLTTDPVFAATSSNTFCSARLRSGFHCVIVCGIRRARFFPGSRPGSRLVSVYGLLI